MTRTERSSHPRALNKDRSENKSGLKSGLRKSGAGAHNWGAYDDELEHEQDLLDQEFDGEGPDLTNVSKNAESATNVQDGKQVVEVTHDAPTATAAAATVAA